MGEIQRHSRSLRIGVHIVSYRWSEPSSAGTAVPSGSSRYGNGSPTSRAQGAEYDRR
ncbi:hypothetical protein [Streptomyces sp. NPDC058299]|uniref:hypothetical protein n=1 Tax=unclassified Streptomyces TaxID=2593676 RepID=UPI0036ED2C14